MVNIAPGSQSLNAIDAKVRVVDGAYADTVNVFDQNGGFAGRISYHAYLAADSVTRFEQRSVGTSPTGAPIVAVDAATVHVNRLATRVRGVLRRRPGRAQSGGSTRRSECATTQKLATVDLHCLARLTNVRSFQKGTDPFWQC